MKTKNRCCGNCGQLKKNPNFNKPGSLEWFKFACPAGVWSSRPNSKECEHHQFRQNYDQTK